MWQFHPIFRPVHITGFYTAFEERFDPDYVFRGETHDFYELVLLLEGSLGVTADADSFILNAPAAILHTPMEFHSLRSENGTAPHIMILSFSATQMPCFEKKIFSLSDEQIDLAQKTLALLHCSTSASHPHAGNVLQGCEKEAQRALLQFETLLLTLSDFEQANAKKESSAGTRNYRQALRVIEQNLFLPLDTAELARLAHMSPSLLKKTFARQAGMGVMEYVRTKKINAAIPLLREGLGVQEIATRLGFSNAGYFSTVFRRITGHSPSYYRNHE